MADREQPYDPYIPSGGAGGQAGQGQNGNMRTAALQAVRYLVHTQESAAHICDRCGVEKQQNCSGLGRRAGVEDPGT
jgi:hypothetical protein